MPDGVIQHKLMMDGVTLDILKYVSRPNAVSGNFCLFAGTMLMAFLLVVAWTRKVRLPMRLVQLRLLQ